MKVDLKAGLFVLQSQAENFWHDCEMYGDPVLEYSDFKEKISDIIADIQVKPKPSNNKRKIDLNIIKGNFVTGICNYCVLRT